MHYKQLQAIARDYNAGVKIHGIANNRNMPIEKVVAALVFDGSMPSSMFNRAITKAKQEVNRKDKRQ